MPWSIDSPQKSQRKIIKFIQKTNEISFIKTINNLINQNVLIAVAMKLRLNFYDFSIHLAYTEIKFQTTIETK